MEGGPDNCIRELAIIEIVIVLTQRERGILDTLMLLNLNVFNVFA